MNAKIRTLSAILLTACMLVSGMPFAAFAEKEPATPTDLAPLEEVAQAETGTGENEETPDGETPAGEQVNPEEPAGEEPTGEGQTEEEPEEETEVRLPELPFGPTGTRGTLKAGEAFEIVLRPEYSQNILVTLTLIPKAGNAPDAANVRMALNGEKKNPVRIENEDPESKELNLQFGTYAAQGSEYILSITSPADADFILTAVKRPEAAPEETEDEVTGKEETDDAEETKVETGDEDAEKPANEAGNEVTADPEPDGKTEEPADEPETPAAETGTNTEEETKTEEPAENAEQPANGEENASAEPVTAEEAETPKAEPVKNEPATPTDLAPAGETQSQPANGSAKTENKKETKEKKTEDKETRPPAEELLALGYYGSQVAMTTGADIFESTEEGAEPAAHLEPGTELWLRQTGDEAWAEIYRTDEKARIRYIRWDDVIITLKPEPEGEEEEEEPLPARSVNITSTITGMQFIPIGAEITMTAELVNFREDDICTYQWQYLDKETETYIDIDGANELTYSYRVTRENFYNTWRLVVLIANAG
ncbi:hypothetical protein JNO48_13280 [Clostridiales bacterium]|nr:hypothetical protein JNO48_13280 [Clostridiales bacterium]